MEISSRICQSERRVASGLRLIGVLVLVVALAYLGDMPWLVKIGAAAIAFFGVVTAAEYWNVWRLGRRR